MSELRVSLFEALSEYDPSFNQKRLVYFALCVTTTLSFLFSALLTQYSQGWRQEFNALFTEDFSTVFNAHTFDMLLLNVFQAIVVS